MPTEHKVICNDGAVIYLPSQPEAEGLANLAAPDPYTPTVAQLYPLGTRAVIGERVFRYGKAGTNAIARPHWLVQNRNVYNDDGLKDCWEGSSTAVATAVDDTTIIFADTNSSHVANFFQRGWMILFYATNTRVHQILKNTAGGTTITFTLVDPIAEADADGAIFATVHPSIYSKMERVHGGGSTQAAFIGVALSPFTASNYGWIQTWGPCYCTPQATFGNAAYERAIIGNYDGSINVVTAPAAGSYHQRVGHTLPEHEDDDHFFMLTIAP